MAKDIQLMGAVFPDVPAIKLPQVGGGLVQFDDTTDADATAEDIAKNKTAYVNGVKVTGTASGGGGGPSNIVTGTFLFDASEANSAHTINLPYTGAGYPVAAMVYPTDGTSVFTASERYPYIMYTLAKTYMDDDPPAYTGDSHRDNMTYAIVNRNKMSEGQACGYAAIYDDTRDAVSSSGISLRFKSDNTMRVYILQAGSASGSGFRANVRYTYVVVYSE